MAVSGLGQDGYFRIQKEVTWGTGVTSSMTLIPALPGSTFEFTPMDIENTNVISSRVKQLPNLGRVKCSFNIKLNLPFTLVGLLMNLFLGTSADASVVDSTYVHTWLTPITGERIGKSFTQQVAFGGDTAVQMVGSVITSMKLSGDNQGQVTLELSGVAKSYTIGVSRITSFTYPSAIPANFSMVNLNIDPADASAFDQYINSFEYSIDLGYDLERYKDGSAYIQNPVFKTIPSVMLKCAVDADKQFREAAKVGTLYDHVLTITSTEYAAGTTFSLVEIEIPKARLKTETSIPFENDRLTMSLDFDCGYGGVTTGSGATVVQSEIRVKDATATYA